jgi:outer membrane protein assembly factor BamE (lipoprotein component of BamABCDE complex)
MRRPIVIAALCAVAATSFAWTAAAQTKDNIIDPGMTKAEVIEHLGPPQSVKTSDTLTFIYYRNGCEKTCGMSDVVTLSRDKVVDAIFRDPNRKYTGESSSPNQVSAAQARKTGQAKQSGTLKVPPSSPPSPGKAEVMPAPKPAPPPPMADTTSMKADTMTKPPMKDSAAAKPPAA